MTIAERRNVLLNSMFGESVCGNDSGVKNEKNEIYPTVSHTYTTISNQISPIALEEAKVKEGLDFILSHFSEPLFPRKISTAATQRKQYEVEDEDRAMLYYQGALWEDCRISGYGLNQINPDLIFIDLDGSSFKKVS
jgi:hypothetical protein